MIFTKRKSYQSTDFGFFNFKKGKAVLHNVNPLPICNCRAGMLKAFRHFEGAT